MATHGLKMILYHEPRDTINVIPYAWQLKGNKKK